MKDLRSLLIIVLCFLLPLIAVVYFGWDVDAKLNDDTLKEVERLRWKHSFPSLKCEDCIGVFDIESDTIKWTRDFLSIWVEDNKLFVETQDGKWFIEMEKVDGQ